MPPSAPTDFQHLAAAVEVLYAEVRALRDALRGLRPDPLAEQRAAIQLIKQAVADAAAIPIRLLDSRARPAHVALARHLAMKLLRERIGLTTYQIAVCLGNRNHSGIVHGIRRFNDLLTIGDPSARRLFDRTTTRLASLYDTDRPNPRTVNQGT